MIKYTGWVCLDCKSINYSKYKNGIRCDNCYSNNTIYLRNGERLSKKEEYNACLVRLGLRTANPFGGSFDAMKVIKY